MTLAAALALLGAAFLVYRFRPGGPLPAVAQPLRDAEAGHARAPLPRVDAHKPTHLEPQVIGELVAVDGSAPIPLGTAVLASSEGLIIGRADSLCHVALLDQEISRRHTRMRWLNGRTMVEDLNSTSGTRLDGMPLAPFDPRPLVAGQTLNIAGLAYRMRPASGSSAEQGQATPSSMSPAGTWGSLISTEGPPVPLSRALLASREGLIIGRSTVLCHIELLDSAVSRRHLRLRLADGELFVEDLNSSDGTQVDGVDLHPFAPRALQPHGLVTIAGIVFRLSKSVS